MLYLAVYLSLSDCEILVPIEMMGNKDSGEPAQMCRLTRAFAASIHSLDVDQVADRNLVPKSHELAHMLKYLHTILGDSNQERTSGIL